MAADYSQAAITPSLGMYALPYATVWPDLAQQLGRLYQDKAAEIPWLPNGWIGQVMALHGQNGQVLVPAPPIYNGKVLPFLQSQAQQDWWADFANSATSIITKYAQQQQAAGAAELQQLYDNAAFWNTGFGASMIGFQQFAYGVRDAFENPLGSKTVWVALAALGVYIALRARK